MVACWRDILTFIIRREEAFLRDADAFKPGRDGRQHEVNDAQGLVSYDQYFALRLTLPSSVQ